MNIVWLDNGRAHPQQVFSGLFTPVLGLFIPVVSAANLSGCRVERGLGQKGA
jgi:hypothetical protein